MTSIFCSKTFSFFSIFLFSPAYDDSLQFPVSCPMIYIPTNYLHALFWLPFFLFWLFTTTFAQPITHTHLDTHTHTHTHTHTYTHTKNVSVKKEAMFSWRHLQNDAQKCRISMYFSVLLFGLIITYLFYIHCSTNMGNLQI